MTARRTAHPAVVAAAAGAGVAGVHDEGIAGPDPGRGVHDPAAGRDPALDRRYPGPLPGVLLHRRCGVDADGQVGGLLRPRHPGPGRDVDRHGVARHRHRIRTRLRRAQAARFDPAGPAAPAGGQDHHDPGGRDRPGRHRDSRRAAARMEPGRAAARASSAPLGSCCWPPWASPASACSWPAC